MEIPEKFDGDVAHHRDNFRVFLNDREVVEQGLVAEIEDIYIADPHPEDEAINGGLILVHQRHWQTRERIAPRGQPLPADALYPVRGKVEIRRARIIDPTEVLLGVVNGNRET